MSETLEKAKKIRLSAKKRKAKKVKTDEPNPDSTSAPVPVPLPVPEVEESVASPEPEVPSAVDETSSTEEQQSSPESVPSSTEIDVDESPAASPEEDKSVFSKVADSVKSAVGLGEEEKTGGRRYRKGKKGLIGLFVGEVKKISKGKADPKLSTELLTKLLNENQ